MTALSATFSDLYLRFGSASDLLKKIVSEDSCDKCTGAMFGDDACERCKGGMFG